MTPSDNQATLESDWLRAKEDAARELVRYQVECQCLSQQARSFELARERLEVAEILESRSRARLQANLRRCEALARSAPVGSRARTP